MAHSDNSSNSHSTMTSDSEDMNRADLSMTNSNPNSGIDEDEHMFTAPSNNQTNNVTNSLTNIQGNQDKQDTQGIDDNENENENGDTSTLNDANATDNNDEKSASSRLNIDITKIETDDRPLRIYLDGVFDVTHYGHFRLFKSIKDKFPNSIVIVGVSGDEETIRLKGQTLLNEHERAESVGHCKWVNEVICPCPWIITQDFIEAQSIDYVAHDGLPYVSAGATDIYDFVKKQGKFIATQRTDGISTTSLINRIVRRYNEFVLRNLKRGVKREDLNLSWTRQKRIEMGAVAVNSITKIREMPNTVKQKSGELMDNVFTWIQDPNALVESFTNTFGAQGKIATRVKQNVQKYKEDFVEYAQYAPM